MATRTHPANQPVLNLQPFSTPEETERIKVKHHTEVTKWDFKWQDVAWALYRASQVQRRGGVFVLEMHTNVFLWAEVCFTRGGFSAEVAKTLWASDLVQCRVAQ